MREAVMQMLELPRRLIRGEIAIENCEHAGFYSPGDHSCRVCETRMECEWLFANDEFAALSEKPMGVVLDALDFTVLYVEARVARARHLSEGCSCELCGWLRGARALVAQSR
jgi:hypothetical protein